ncbi:MAG: alpha/beta hydrolase [Gemmatimonadetes bacterium]|nr:alpha/beta hydrolase [Gemmatimonadota bacterium]
MFQGFERARATLSATDIAYVVGGTGAPVLLLHGYPQTHVAWAEVAPLLAERLTVVVPDLRGYGDSGAPPPDPDHFAYSKRAMGQDMAQLMTGLGFAQFAIGGHDRGGRVAFRMALDYRDRVTKLATLDIVPTLDKTEAIDSVLLASRRVPDRAGVRPLLMRPRGSVREIDAKAKRVVGGPVRGRNLQDPHVVEGTLARIEVRILPHGDQLGSTYRVRPRRVLDIDRVADRRQLAVRARPAVARPGHVVDLLVRLTRSVHPSLHDLDAVEIAAVWVFECGDEEARGLAGGSG